MNQGKIEQEGTPQDVYDKPANPFVYNFLGNVNLFHGRVHNGKVRIGDAELIHGQTSHRDQSTVVAYVRPHDIEISHNQTLDFAIPAKIHHINPAGPMVRIQLLRQDTTELVEAELTREIYGKLQPEKYQSVFIRIRNPQIFTEDYVI